MSKIKCYTREKKNKQNYTTCLGFQVGNDKGQKGNEKKSKNKILRKDMVKTKKEAIDDFISKGVKKLETERVVKTVGKQLEKDRQRAKMKKKIEEKRQKAKMRKKIGEKAQGLGKYQKGYLFGHALEGGFKANEFTTEAEALKVAQLNKDKVGGITKFTKRGTTFYQLRKGKVVKRAPLGRDEKSLVI
tara:strand:- start:819 stop:1382 length:564 start_codon:yes stop_codon:yes gene_type:complete